ncbi:MAG: hypothetical protein WBD36_14885 [Bacteroidota bacterium]
MTWKRFLLALAALVATTLSAVAGGSTYSRYGFGDLILFGGSRTFALGGAGISLVTDGFINRLNPAALAKISLTRFSGGFEYSRFSSQSGEGDSKYARGGFQGIAFAIPISKPDGIVMSMESMPYSLVSYAVRQTAVQSSVSSDQTYYGSGGLSALALGVSASVKTGFHVGAKLNYLYGTTRQLATVKFTDASLTDYNIDRSSYYRGFNLTLGSILEDVGTVVGFAPLKNFTAGIVLTTPTSLSVTENRSYSSIETTLTRSGHADVPLTLGIGTSYLVGTRYQVVGDLVMQQWGSALFYGIHPTELRSSLRVALGLEVMPERSNSYFQSIVYRAGFSYHSTYYELNGQPVDEILVTGGLGLPLGLDSRLNIGLQAGVRGTMTGGLQKDTIIRLSLAISASEAWFLKFEEE